MSLFQKVKKLEDEKLESQRIFAEYKGVDQHLKGEPQIWCEHLQKFKRQTEKQIQAQKQYVS